MGAWCSRDTLTGRSSGFITSASFLTFYAGLADAHRDRVMRHHFDRIAGLIDYVMPSLDPADPGFQMIRYWRGPVWAVVNYMIGTGLAEAGDRARADRVRGDTLALMERNGFYEAYSPVDGSGSGGEKSVALDPGIKGKGYDDGFDALPNGLKALSYSTLANAGKVHPLLGGQPVDACLLYTSPSPRD